MPRVDGKALAKRVTRVCGRACRARSGVWAPWRDRAGPRATYVGLAPPGAAELVASPKATPGSSMMVTTVAVGLLSFVLGASLSRWKRPRHAYLPIAEDY